jgi:hypothetical protein
LNEVEISYIYKIHSRVEIALSPSNRSKEASKLRIRTVDLCKEKEGKLKGAYNKTKTISLNTPSNRYPFGHFFGHADSQGRIMSKNHALEYSRSRYNRKSFEANKDVP